LSDYTNSDIATAHMTEPSETTPQKKKETVTPFLERLIREFIDLFAQMFTTPFALLRYNRAFRDQITALSKDDLETAYPETVARPLTFFVLFLGAHYVLLNIYWKMMFPSKSLSLALASSKGDAATIIAEKIQQPHTKVENILTQTYGWLHDTFGNTQAVLIIASMLTLVVAAKAWFISMFGHLLRSPIRFSTALYASAYALGTFIFFQYAFIALRVLIGTILPDPAFLVAYSITIYGSLVLSLLLVIRVNQIIQQADNTSMLPTYGAWFLGTVIWHFAVVVWEPLINPANMAQWCH
jgi:hypothetical protein